jgi:hypothetical protein
MGANLRKNWGIFLFFSKINEIIYHLENKNAALNLRLTQIFK